MCGNLCVRPGTYRPGRLIDHLALVHEVNTGETIRNDPNQIEWATRTATFKQRSTTKKNPLAKTKKLKSTKSLKENFE